MNLTTIVGQENTIGILLDPFKSDRITSINFYGSINAFEKEFTWWCKVEFVNGNTHGSQKFSNYKKDEFAQLVKDVEAFINSLTI